MRAMLDACVLYPTVMREMLVGAAAAGFFEPQWAPRILEEWARAAARHGGQDEVLARGEAARLNAQFPRATVRFEENAFARLWLPDPNDVHVLAAAIAGSSDVVVTNNSKDFPRGILAEEGLTRIDPDGLLRGGFAADPAGMRAVAVAVQEKAEALSGAHWPLRKLMKKARLPRLGKALDV